MLVSPQNTYEDLLFIQVCSDPTPGLCSTAQNQKQSPLFCAAALQHRLTTCLSQQRDTYEYTGVQTRALQYCSGQNTSPTALCCCAAQAHSLLVSPQRTYEDLLFTQMCSDPTPGLCNTAQSKMQSPLFSAAVQHMLTTCLSQQRDTC